MSTELKSCHKVDGGMHPLNVEALETTVAETYAWSASLF